MFEASPVKKFMRSYLKNTNTKRTGGMTRVEEHLPSKHEALIQPRVSQKKKKQKQQISQMKCYIQLYQSLINFD
jgi:hypothetical protein